MCDPRRLLILSPLLLLVALTTVVGARTPSASAAHGPETRVRAIPTATADQQSSETPGHVGCLRPETAQLVSGACVATNTADDLVRFDPEWASRQIAGQNLPGSTGYATTPGGNTLSVHAAERTFLGGPGRAPIEPSLIDDILSQGTRVTYRGINDTVKVSAPNLCGKCYVVVDAQTGTHVVTVMVPK